MGTTFVWALLWGILIIFLVALAAGIAGGFIAVVRENRREAEAKVHAQRQTHVNDWLRTAQTEKNIYGYPLHDSEGNLILGDDADHGKP